MNCTTKTVKILVVDDDSLNLQNLARTLASAGFATVVVANGEEATEQINAEQFDVVVSDVRMPGMSGLELMRNIRGRFPALPVIIMTGLVEEETRAAASAWGAVALLQKPVNRGELIAAIRMALAGFAPPCTPQFTNEAEAVTKAARPVNRPIIPAY